MPFKLHQHLLLALVLALPACQRKSNPVSGTIEVDEVHVAPRMGGRVEKIFAREGDVLHPGQVIMQLDAAELPAQRDLARAQVDAASRDVESHQAQLEFMRADAKRSRNCCAAKLFRQTKPSAPPVSRTPRKKPSKPRRCAWPKRMPTWRKSKRN